MSNKYAIHTSNLHYAHSRDASWTFSNIQLERGQHLLVLGDSGSGKTTLLHLLSGLLKPMSGKIFIDGKDLATLKKTAVDEIRGHKIGMVFQRPHFIQSLNVKENIALARQLPNQLNEENNIEELIAQLNITHLANHKINTLSEGEKQRVGIARALANNPILLLADEPTSALDDKNCDAVIDLLINTSKRLNCALIVVTHDARIKPHFPKHLTIKS